MQDLFATKSVRKMPEIHLTPLVVSSPSTSTLGLPAQAHAEYTSGPQPAVPLNHDKLDVLWGINNRGSLPRSSLRIYEDKYRSVIVGAPSNKSANAEKLTLKAKSDIPSHVETSAGTNSLYHDRSAKTNSISATCVVCCLELEPHELEFSRRFSCSHVLHTMCVDAFLEMVLRTSRAPSCLLCHTVYLNSDLTFLQHRLPQHFSPKKVTSAIAPEDINASAMSKGIKPSCGSVVARKSSTCSHELPQLHEPPLLDEEEDESDYDMNEAMTPEGKPFSESPVKYSSLELKQPPLAFDAMAYTIKEESSSEKRASKTSIKSLEHEKDDEHDGAEALKLGPAINISYSLISDVPSVNCPINSPDSFDFSLPGSPTTNFTHTLFENSKECEIHRITPPGANMSVLEVRSSLFLGASENAKLHKVLISLKASKPLPSLISNLPLKLQSDDYEYAYKIYEQLKECQDGSKLDCSKYGDLRLHSVFSVYELGYDKYLDDLLAIDAYLFEKAIILTSKSGDLVYPVIDLIKDFREAKVYSDTPSIIHFNLQDVTLPSVCLRASSSTEVCIWYEALHSFRGFFPLRRPEFQSFCLNLNHELDFQGCLPQLSQLSVICTSYEMSQTEYVSELLHELVSRSNESDRLLVVVYNDQQVFTVFESSSLFMREWSKWVQRNRSSPNRSTMMTRSITLDNVLSSISSLLGPSDKVGTNIFIVLIVDRKIPLNMRLTEFVDSGIHIHTVGFTVGHDIPSLSRIARETDGFYVSVQDISDIKENVLHIQDIERHGNLRSVAVGIRPRLGARVVRMRCSQLNAVNNLKLDGETKREQKWEIGSLSVGYAKTLILDIEGYIPCDQPVVELNIRGKNFDNHGSRWFMEYIRVRAPVVRDEIDQPPNMLKSLLNLEEIFCITFTLVEDLLACLLFSQSTVAHKRVKRVQTVLKAMLPPKDQEDLLGLVNVVQRCNLLFEGFLVYFSEHEMRVPECMLKLVRTLWTLQTRKVWRANNEFEKLFR